MHLAVEQEIRDLIKKDGRITFAQFMQTCLYSPRGGFYSSRGNRISTHFGTSPTSHPVFGAEQIAEHHLAVVHHREKIRVEVADDVRAHRLENARVDRARAGPQKKP